MLRNGVSGELHVFEKGSHGKGLAKTIQGTSEWPNVCRRWLEGKQFVTPNAQK
jgi:hypothetical protein